MTNPNPMPVGWWLHSSGKAMFVAFDERSIGEESNIPILAYTSKGNYNWFAPDSFLHTLPAGAGFDWKPEPEIVYPRWAVPTSVTMTERKTDNKEIAYYKFESEDSGKTFCMDGTSFNWFVFDLDSNEYQYTTQNAAEARIVKPPKYPEYWTPHNSRYAYLRRDSDTTHVCVDLAGIESNPCNWSGIIHDGRTRLTKAEAEARVVRRKSIPEQCPDRWFIWSDDRYPIAFVKHASGQVFNLNVDSILEQSDDWDGGYEEQLANGELVEVTEFSAKAFLKRPRSASQIPKHEPPKPNRIPVRLYWYYGNVVACFAHSPPTDPSFVEIKLDPQMIISGSGFYVEGRIA